MSIEVEEDSLTENEFYNLKVGDKLRCIGNSSDYYYWTFFKDSVEENAIIKITSTRSSLRTVQYYFNFIKGYRPNPQTKSRFSIPTLCGYRKSWKTHKDVKPPWELLDWA